MVEQKKFAEQQSFAASQQAFPTKAPIAPAPIAPVGLAQPILSNNSNIISATPFQKVSEKVSVFEVSPQPIITAQAVPLAASILPQKMPIAQAIPAMPAPTTSTFVQQPMMMQQPMQSVHPMQSIPLQQQKPISMARNIPITEKRPFTETIAPKLNIAETTKPTISEAVELVEKQMGIEKQTFHLPSSGLQAEGIDTSLPESLTNLRPIQRAEEAVSSVAATASNLATSAAETAVLATAQGVESAKNLASSVASTASDIAEGTMEVAANLGSGIAQTASNVASKTAEVASSVGSAVAAKTADVVEGAKEVVSEAVNKAPEVASAVAAKTVDIAEGTAEVVSSAAHKGAELAADVGVGVASVASRTAELAVESGLLERGKEMVSAAAHASLEAAEAVVHMGASVVSAAAHMGSQLLSGAVEMMVPPVVEESEFLEKEISELSLEEADLTWVYPKIFTPAFMEAVIDISPIEFETDFRGLEFDIKGLSREGLWWGRAEQVDVAFGIRRLRMVCIFDSRLWSLSALEDWFGVELRDKVQGIEFVGVNRLGKL